MLSYYRADEVEDYEPETRYRGGGYRDREREEKVILPTAPRASLGSNIDEDRIPNHPPFTAYLANLSYDIDVEDLYRFFEKQNVTNIRLVRDGDQETGRLKGYGYADFGDRQSLIDALLMNEQSVKNRKIKIDLSNSGGGNDRYGNNRGGRGDRMDNRRYGDDEGGEDRTTGDWRSGGGLPAFRDDDRGGRGGFDRGGDRGGDRGKK